MVFSQHFTYLWLTLLQTNPLPMPVFELGPTASRHSFRSMNSHLNIGVRSTHRRPDSPDRKM